MSAAAPDLLPLVGRKVGNYRVESLLGSGAMGAVYLLRHEQLPNTFAALKVLKREHADSPSMRDRFVQEAVIAAALGSQRIARPLDLGRFDDGIHYIVMEYVPGRTLAARLDESGPLPCAVALRIAYRVADTMAVAHASGVVHRDLKPSNLMLTGTEDDPGVKVLDFGVARASGVLRVATTFESAIIGSPGYMSPEAATGLPVDGRTDVFSLGVILFRMLTGSLPFPSATTQSGIAALLNATPPRIVAGRPPALDAVPASVQELVDRTLVKDSVARLAMKELREELLEVLRQLGDADGVSVMQSLDADHVAATPQPGALDATVSLPPSTDHPVDFDRLRVQLQKLAAERAPDPPGSTDRLPSPFAWSRARVVGTGLVVLAAVLAASALWMRPRQRSTGVQSPKDARLARLFEDGEALLWDRDLNEARKKFTAVLDAAPTFAPARASLARALQSFDPATATEEAKRVLGSSSTISAEEQPWVFARAKEASGDYAGAIEPWRAAFSRNGRLQEGVGLLSAQFRAGRLDDARVSLKILRRLPAPDGDDPRIDLAAALLESDWPAQRRLTERAATVADQRGLPLVRAAALLQLSAILLNLGEPDQAVLAAGEAKAIYQRRSDACGEVAALALLTSSYWRKNDSVRAGEAIAESLPLARANQCNRSLLTQLANSVIVSGYRGQFEAGRRSADELVELAKRLGFPSYPDVANVDLALFHQDLPAAQALYRAAIPAARKMVDSRMLSWILTDAGEILIWMGDFAAARAQLQEALDLRIAMNERATVHRTKRQLAWLLYEEGRLEEAAREAEATRVEAGQVGAVEDQAISAALLANIRLDAGHLEEARQAADSAMGRANASESPHVRNLIGLAAARARLRSTSLEVQAEARRSLEQLAREAGSVGLRGDALGARLALLEDAVRTQQRGATGRVAELARDAEKLGFGLIARRAHRLLTER